MTLQQFHIRALLRAPDGLEATRKHALFDDTPMLGGVESPKLNMGAS